MSSCGCKSVNLGTHSFNPIFTTIAAAATLSVSICTRFQGLEVILAYIKHIHSFGWDWI